MISFQVFGPFGMVDDDGIDRRPKLRKSRAILAILAASPRHRKSRAWFRNLLWEDRAHEQSLSSLRSALIDIRRHLGPHVDLLIADHEDISLDPSGFAVDESDGSETLLEGFDLAHAPNFEDWLREARASMVDHLVPQAALPRAESQPHVENPPRFLLASRADQPSTATQMQCDALVDGIAKSLDDLGLADVVDQRGLGLSLEDFLYAAHGADCSHLLISEAAEGPGGTIVRLKATEAASGKLVWSKSLTGASILDLEDASALGTVAEFVDVVAGRLLRDWSFDLEHSPPGLIAAVGVNQIFKLGSQNLDRADQLLRQAHRMDPRGRYLAWRAYLRTIILGEMKYVDREAVIEEGTSLAKRALEDEPHNSMVLALCSQVENMLHNEYYNAFDLASQALELNRCNPLAWISLGAATAFLDDPAAGQRFAKMGARLSKGTAASFMAESWASSASVLAGDTKSALAHAELAHNRASSFAPPMRYLSAIYCADGLYSEAMEMAEKLRQFEPDFTFDRLRDDGYPADCLRQAKLVDALPQREI